MSYPPSSSTSPFADAGGNSDHAQGPARKKMRKGTKSCLECRRRKIKCTFEEGRTAICNECYARGSTCIDQEHGDINSYTQQAVDQSAYSLRERVTQLEGLVKQVLHRVPDGAQQNITDPALERSQLDAQAAEVLKSLKTNGPRDPSPGEESMYLPGGQRDEAPAMTLFDNAVIQRKESQPTVSRAQYNKQKTLISALSQMLPSPHDLEIILESSHEWWTIWRKMFPEITDNRCETMKESVSHSLRSEKPAEIAKIMLCIAISIHQMPDGFDWKRLQMKDTQSQLMDKYISTVNKLIISDDELAATIDGIEVMALEAKYQVNMGRPRRAWLLYHRALAFAQLLGFHKLANQANKHTHDYKRQMGIWTHLIVGDRYLSLLLGLPYTVPDNFCAPYMGAAAAPHFANEGEAYYLKILPIVTALIDRNQAVTPMAYSATMRLDQELEESAAAQTPGWWTTDLLPNQRVEDHFDRLQAQFVHYQTKVLLHQPFMLKAAESSNDKRHQYSHSQALEGARGMLKYYDALRTNQAVGPFICKLVDFQAFTAAMLLLLNLCGYSAQHRGGMAQMPDLEQDQKDSDLIDNCIALLNVASKEVGGVVAAQSAQALQMLARVREGICEKDQEQCEKTSCTVSIPYFGTISIGMGKQFVPIKPGTYTKAAGETRSVKMMVPSAGVVPNATGLPTPPSVTSSGSTQPSPTNNTLDNFGSANRLPHFESTQYIAPGLDTWPADDDPFVTFDSFMALPGQNFGSMDFSTGGASSTGTGYTPQSFTPEQMNSTTGMEAAGVSAAGFPFTGFPFGGQSTSNVDLDQGWNWFGVDAPSMQ